MATPILQKCILVLGILFIWSSSQAETIQVAQHQFHESYSKEVKISGSVKAGVMLESISQRIVPDSLYIDLGTESGSLLKVKMISIDGRYEADFNYQVEKGANGMTRFTIPTKLKDIICQYSPQHLAVLASLKSADKNKKAVIVPASWGKPNSQEMTIFLNSGVSRTFLKLYRPDSGSEKQTCTTIEEETATAYDTQCTISDFTRFDLSKTKILRKNYDSYFKPVKLRIESF